jgi:hypothetical protein
MVAGFRYLVMSATVRNKAEKNSKNSVHLVGKTPEEGTEVSSGRVTLAGVAGAAPVTFDPTNTHDCPSMFADKWQAGE